MNTTEVVVEIRPEKKIQARTDRELHQYRWGHQLKSFIEIEIRAITPLTFCLIVGNE